jgi:hypothetical protein
VLCPGPIGGLSRITGFANMASISSGVADRFRANGVAVEITHALGFYTRFELPCRFNLLFKPFPVFVRHQGHT